MRIDLFVWWWEKWVVECYSTTVVAAYVVLVTCCYYNTGNYATIEDRTTDDKQINYKVDPG